MSYRLLLMILWATLLVFAVELTAGWASQSLCLLAESLHTLIDVFSALLGLVAVASPRRTLGKEVWGYGRSEATGALLLTAVLGFAGFSIGAIASSQLIAAFWQNAASAFPIQITAPLMILTWVVNLLLLAAVLAASRQSQRMNSLALKLTSQHILTDVWITGLVLVCLVVIAQGYRWLDPALAILVVALSARSLWLVLHQQLPMLLKPMAIAPEAINKIACQVEGVTRCTRILSRGLVGRHVWIELHLALHPEFMVLSSSIGDRVKKSLRDHYGPVKTQIWLEQTNRLTKRSAAQQSRP